MALAKLWQWMGRLIHVPVQKVTAPQGEVVPIRLAEVLRQVPGQWVALHNGRVIEAARTLDELMGILASKAITNATVMRAPAEGESELVGLG